MNAVSYPGPVRKTLGAAAAVAVVAATVAGCGSTHSPDLVVFAASSLKQSFTAIGDQLEAENPGADIEFSFAGSADLLAQLTGGAAADVIATADAATMGKANAAGLLAGDPTDFASNTLAIVVAPGNPKKVASFKDLAAPGLSVVVCAPPVPCGAATARIEKATGVTLDPVSEEAQVSDVLTKVTSGQADAGIVYVTDARAAGDKVTAVEFPEAAGAVNVYPIAMLQDSANPELAGKFIDLVTGEAGQQILGAAGFGKP